MAAAQYPAPGARTNALAINSGMSTEGMVNASTPQVKGIGTGGNTCTANSATMASNAFTMRIMSASLMLDGTTLPSVEDIEISLVWRGSAGSYLDVEHCLAGPCAGRPHHDAR